GVTPSISLTPAMSLGVTNLSVSPAALTPVAPAVGSMNLAAPAAAAQAAPVSASALTPALSRQGRERGLAAAVAQPAAQGELKKFDAPVRSMLEAPAKVAPAAADIGKMSGGDAHAAGIGLMDRVLGTRSIRSSAADDSGAAPVPGRMGESKSGLDRTAAADPKPAKD